MGRPIKKKFFGNLNPGGAGGEGVASVTLSTSSLTVSTLTVTVVFSAPTLAGGVTALGTPVKTGNTVTSVTIDTAGSGYLSAPSVTFIAPGGTTGTGVAVLTSSAINALDVTAYVPGGSSSVQGDIVKQEASRRYLVATAQGTGQCRLVTTSTLAEGEMTLIATDVNGSTYYVSKLTARRATLAQQTVSGSFEYATGDVTGWTIDAATTGTVSLATV